MLPSPELETKPLALRRAHTVIVLDDDGRALSALRRSLRGEPYALLTSDDPLRVLDWVDSRDVSLIVSDLRMPQMDGTDLLEDVRRRSPLTVGVILTGFPEDLALSPALQNWIRRVILKPWEDRWLRATLRQLLREREISFASDDPSEFEPDIGGEG